MTKKKAPRKAYCPPIGRCIYCGITEGDLSDEHIIPAALNGTWVLPHASCRVCAETTGRFERAVLKEGFLRAPRAALGFFTRNPQERPQILPMIINGVEQMVATHDYPINLSLLELTPPGFVARLPNRPGIHIRGYAMSMNTERVMRIAQSAAASLGHGDRDNTTGQISISLGWSDTYGQDSVEKQGSLEAFLRLLVKIAFCTVIGQQGEAAVDPKLARGLILGTNNNLSHFVGSIAQETPRECLPKSVTRAEDSNDPSKPHEFHRISVERCRGMWHVFIQLFRHLFADNPPVYHVVVGEAKVPRSRTAVGR